MGETEKREKRDYKCKVRGRREGGEQRGSKQEIYPLGENLVVCLCKNELATFEGVVASPRRVSL